MSELEPKPPELLQKIEWIRLHGLKHWKPLLVALAVVFIAGGSKYYYSSATGKTPASNTTQKVDPTGKQQR